MTGNRGGKAGKISTAVAAAAAAVAVLVSGASAPEPLVAMTVEQVEYTPTGAGVLSDEERAKSIGAALDRAGITSPVERRRWSAALEYITVHEAGGDADRSASDATAVGPLQADGVPSAAARGAWQLVPTVFAAHHVPGTSTNIYDPEAGAAATVGYLRQLLAESNNDYPALSLLHSN